MKSSHPGREASEDDREVLNHLGMIFILVFRPGEVLKFPERMDP